MTLADRDADEDLKLYLRYLDYCADLHKLRPLNLPMDFLEWKILEENPDA